MKKLRITVEGKVYEVEVEILGEEHTPSHGQLAPPSSPIVTRSVSVGQAAPPTQSSSSAQTGTAAPGAVTSPLTGRVVEVAVKEGQSVKEGETLITIEAMKMNTFVYAPRAGTVTGVFVNSGDAVEEGQALVKIE
jgi:biotin carboxyl carrier protein